MIGNMVSEDTILGKLGPLPICWQIGPLENVGAANWAGANRTPAYFPFDIDITIVGRTYSSTK